MKFDLKFKQVEVSRDEMRDISGGRFASITSEHGDVMCCWDDDPSNCSACVTNGQHTCVEGAHIQHC